VAARFDFFAVDYRFAVLYAAPVEYGQRKKVLATNLWQTLTGLPSGTRAKTTQITKQANYEQLTKKPADLCKRGDSQLASFIEKRLAFCESLECKKRFQFRVGAQPFEAFG
jgi:hypothetical protein